MFGGITSGFDGTATVNGTPNTALALGTPYALSQISDILRSSAASESSFPWEPEFQQYVPARLQYEEGQDRDHLYGQVLRVVSPATVPNPAVYSTFEPYISFVRARSISTPIRGSFNPAQFFNLNAVIDPNGNLVMTGTVTIFPVAQTKIVIASPDLPGWTEQTTMAGFWRNLCRRNRTWGGLASPATSPKHQVIDIKASNEICFDT